MSTRVILAWQPERGVSDVRARVYGKTARKRKVAPTTCPSGSLTRLCLDLTQSRRHSQEHESAVGEVHGEKELHGRIQSERNQASA
jgi:hypothetical protein